MLEQRLSARFEQIFFQDVVMGCDVNVPARKNLSSILSKEQTPNFVGNRTHLKSSNEGSSNTGLPSTLPKSSIVLADIDINKKLKPIKAPIKNVTEGNAK